MQILLVGLNHHTAPVAVREKVAFTEKQVKKAIPLLDSKVDQPVILSTCNRTEIYAVVENPENAAEIVTTFLSSFHKIEISSIQRLLYIKTDLEAVTHLFQVASGLDSMVFGESEILGQIRGALTTASEAKALPQTISRLFHRAIRTGRRVRNETHIGRNPLSVSYVAVELATKILGDLNNLCVLLIGAGEAGTLLAKALMSANVEEIMISNRTPEKSTELAEELGGKTVLFEDALTNLANADVIITATEASEHIITKDAVAKLSTSNPQKSVSLFDLSVPRNIDPDVASLNGVNLYNIDDLVTITRDNLTERHGASSDANKIIDEEIIEFTRWWETLDTVPIIKSLREESERIRSEEISRALSKLSNLTEEELDTIQAMSRSIVRRLLHNPTMSLKKQKPTDLHIDFLKNLFGI